MKIDLDKLIHHDASDDCPVCRTQDIVGAILVPAAAAWEQHNDLPLCSMALHGAAGLLAVMLQDGVPRDRIEEALGKVLDDIELQIEEDGTMGGPPQGSA